MLKKLSMKLQSRGYMYIAVKEKRTEGPDEEIKQELDYGYSYERFFSYYTPHEIKEYLRQIRVPIVFETVTQSGKTNWIQVIGQKAA